MSSAYSLARHPRCHLPLLSFSPFHLPAYLPAAKQYQDLARLLSRLSDRQLARLQPMVGEDVVDAVALAARISHRNQGRQRQESLIAKLLRVTVQDADVPQLQVSESGGVSSAGRDGAQSCPHCAPLLSFPDRFPNRSACLARWPQAAIDSVRTGQGVIANPAVEQQLQLWMHALLSSSTVAGASGDSSSSSADPSAHVFGLAVASGIDLQQIRQLLRQAQEVQEPAVAAPHDSDDEDGGAAASTAAGRGTGLPRPTSKAQKARRQLRALLQPLALEQLEAASDEE